MEELIKLLDTELEYIGYKIYDNEIHISVRSHRKEAQCGNAHERGSQKWEQRFSKREPNGGFFFCLLIIVMGAGINLSMQLIKINKSGTA